MTDPAIPQADDFLADCRVLHDLLAGVTAEAWERPTAFKGWTAIDIVGHLHLADTAALAALDGAEAFERHMAGFRAAVDHGEGALAYTRRWHGLADGDALLALWIATAGELAEQYRDLDPRRRIPWGRGPDMSARSCMSARHMESWAHGQALFDLLGVERAEADRIRNIAILGVNTFEWSFRVRGLEAPAERPYLRLEAPSGAQWEWNDPRSASRIEGAAVDFCRVVTQTRNIADTRLSIDGDAASSWMAIAQCFAGPPHPPPLAGTRTMQPA